MFCIAARRMGYRVHTFSPDEDTPTGQVADVEVTAEYDDVDALRAFAGSVDVVTFGPVTVTVGAEAAAWAPTLNIADCWPAGMVMELDVPGARPRTDRAGWGVSVSGIGSGAGWLSVTVTFVLFPMTIVGLLGRPLAIPSLHVWGERDLLARDTAAQLVERFAPETREIAVWSGPHVVPTRGDGADAIVGFLARQLGLARVAE